MRLSQPAHIPGSLGCIVHAHRDAATKQYIRKNNESKPEETVGVLSYLVRNDEKPLRAWRNKSSQKRPTNQKYDPSKSS